MNLLAPVKDIMTTKLVTLHPEESIKKVEKHFDENNIHHLPVIEDNKLIGIVSKSDFLFFKRGFADHSTDARIDEFRMRTKKVRDIMTKGLAKMEPDDRINVALEVFKRNLFHAILIVEEEELKGIVTPFDIINAISNN